MAPPKKVRPTPPPKPAAPLGDLPPLPPAHPTDMDVERMIQNAAKKLGVEHQPTGGASDIELYPTDQGLVDFRLARGGKKPRGGNYA